jgi:hypothetical protein
VAVEENMERKSVIGWFEGKRLAKKRKDREIEGVVEGRERMRY